MEEKRRIKNDSENRHVARVDSIAKSWAEEKFANHPALVLHQGFPDVTLLLGMTHTGALPAISLLNQGLYPHALAASQTLQYILTQAHPESEVLRPSWQGSLKGGMQNSQFWKCHHFCGIHVRCQSRHSVRRVRNLTGCKLWIGSQCHASQTTIK